MYQLGPWLEAVRDGRPRPQIPTASALRSALVMCLVRLGSLHGLEQARGNPFWRQYLGGSVPSADTIGRVFAGLECDAVRAILREVYRRQKRNKALRAVSQGLFGLVIDGHECSSSYLRSCLQCLQRLVHTAGGERLQYYHRQVTAMLVGGNAQVLLDCELQQPGEDEVAAAMRLLRRVLAHYPRAFDVVLVDGLYLREELFRLVLDHGKDVLVVLKDERRNLLEDARSLFELVSPTVNQQGRTLRQCWDIESSLSWGQLDHPLRVVRSLETTSVQRQLGGKRERRTSDWIWATTLSPHRASTATVIQLGHARWVIENQGFNELVNEWHADHLYKHHPNAIVGFWLVTMLAYNLFHAFLRLNLKPMLRRRHTAKHWAHLLSSDFYDGRPWPFRRALTCLRC